MVLEMKNVYFAVFTFSMIALWSPGHHGVLTSVVYVNQTTQVTLSSNIDRTTGFSLSFLTCSKGIIINQGADLMVALENPDSNAVSYHTVLKIVLRKTNSENETIVLTPKYSLESNILMTLQVDVNATGIKSVLKPNPSQVKGLNITAVETFSKGDFTNLNRTTAQLVLGSRTFSGCIYSGNQINVDAVKSSCPLDNWAPCKSQVCPVGFDGRFCQNNIDICKKNKGICNYNGDCKDEVNGFTCLCGSRYTGNTCETWLGSPCNSNSTVCQNGGICTTTSDGNDYTCTCKESYTGRHCESNYLPCAQTPCKNNGNCSIASVPSGYKCSCPPGFTGTKCEVSQKTCEPSCQNGNCVGDLLTNGFKCQCWTGFTGDICDININECKQTPKICNNGTCKDRYGTYTCTCNAGYTGSSCQLEINECDSKPCVNGTCIDKFLDYECSCYPGSEGKNCDKETDECKLSYCKNSKSCLDKFDDYQCICNEGYVGKNCTEDVNECNTTSNPCLNNGICVNNIGGYRCDCKPGYEGNNCSFDTNECKDNPCGVNGKCIDEIANYTCKCDSGYMGRNCETNVDDCSLLGNPCKNNGKCIDGLNNYTCNCISSWKGRNCTEEQDPCTLFSPCQNNANCSRDVNIGYTCTCTEEYGGKNCSEKIGLCFPSSPCKFGSCIYTSNFTNYTCDCQSGYEGRNCTDNINECTRIPNVCSSLDKTALCTDTEGSYVCNCTTKFQGKNCTEDVDECKVYPNFCNGRGDCENLGNRPGARCYCIPGWFGLQCENQFFPCANYRLQNGEDFCMNGGKCRDQGDDPICNCTHTGFNGKRCEININECLSNPCKYDSKCNDLINDFNCTCKAGYAGKDCSININECEPQPCGNGTCKDEVNGYNCTCFDGYNGTNCDNDINWCTGDVCQHGSSCIDGNMTYTCPCLPGYTGKNCEVDIDECDNNPCKYTDRDKNVVENVCVEKSNLTAMQLYNFTVNATTFHNRDGYKCVCVTGLTGTNCDTDLPNCNHTMCQNNSTCVDLVNKYRCACLQGFEGKDCDTNINDCADEPCQNNGTCHDGIDSYTCSCHGNFTGRNCEQVMNYCTVYKPCKNNASCQLKEGDAFTCVCQNGYRGEQCEQSTTANFAGYGQWSVSVSPNTSHTVSFRFKTTLNGFLAVLNSQSSSLYIFLQEGNLQFRQNGQTKTATGSSYIDAKWHTLKMNLSNQEMMFSVDNINPEVVSSIKIDNIISATLGGSEIGIASNFTGCMQDFTINNEVYSPSIHGTHEGIHIGSCQRTEQCNKSSCTNGNGKCIDLWTTSSCQCYRQYFGDQCEQEIKAFSFQQQSQNITRRRRATTSGNFVSADVNFRLNATVGFSFLMRTRQSDGFVALLSNTKPTSISDPYILVTIENNRLKFTMNSDQRNPQSFSTVFSKGKWIDVKITSTTISVQDTNIPLSPPFELQVNFIFMGGVDNEQLYLKLFTKPYFDGCLQAASLGETFLTNQQIPSASTPVTTSPNIIVGCPGKEVCFDNTCLFDGECKDEWNAFSCSCQPGYSGSTCSLYGCRLNDTCPADSNCADIPLSMPPQTKCSKALTYNGVDTFTDVTLSQQVTNTNLTFTLRTRQTEAVVLQTNSTNSMKFNVTIVDGKLVFTGNYGSGIMQLKDSKTINDGIQHTVLLETAAGKTILYVDREKREEESIDLLNTAWKTSVNKIVIGKGDGVTPYYQGCLNALSVGEVNIALETQLSTGSVVTGCNSSNDSCSPSPCQNGGNCEDVFNEYYCHCTKYYAGRNCTLTKEIDCNFTTNLCNNSTCLTLPIGKSSNVSDRGMDFFQCTCNSGYTGVLCQTKCVAGYTGKNCEVNIDDCKSNPCKNNRNCSDGINNYTCDCGGVFQGKNCEFDVLECNDTNTCSKKGNCTEKYGGFACTCEKGYFGKNCQYNNTDICEKRNPCMNHGICSNDIFGYNCTCIGNYHGVNCESLSTDTDDDNNLPLILGLVLAGVFIILMVIIICLVRYCRDKSGMEGTYSPNKEEQAGGNVEMHAIKKPKTERLI